MASILIKLGTPASLTLLNADMTANKSGVIDGVTIPVATA
jgi:hypothetical protein